MFTYRVNEEIELRLVDFSHCNELHELIDKNRKFLRIWLGWVDKDELIEDTTRFIKFAKEENANNKGLKATIWYCDKLVGLIDHHEVNHSRKCLEIGYWLDEDFNGRGIVTKSVLSMIDYAFELGMNKVEIRCAEGNESSRKIPIRLGFKEEGTIRDAEYLYDHYVDHVVYGMLKSEWSKNESN